MKSIILISAICLQIGWSYGEPSDGAGAFAYQDSRGNRYGGTYGLKDGRVVDAQGKFPPDFQPPSFEGFDNFIPEYFRNFDNILQDVSRTFSPGKPFFSRFPFRRAFDSNIENQKLASNAARKAFDLTSNQAGYNTNFASRFPFNNFPAFGGFPGMPGAGPSGFYGFPGQGFPRPPFGNANTAFASAGAGPGFVHQVAAINPNNPDMPNVNHFAESVPNPSRNAYSVSSSSYASSSNVNGQEISHRGAETVVNDNGKISKYAVHD